MVKIEYIGGFVALQISEKEMMKIRSIVECVVSRVGATVVRVNTRFSNSI